MDWEWDPSRHRRYDASSCCSHIVAIFDVVLTSVYCSHLRCLSRHLSLPPLDGTMIMTPLLEVKLPSFPPYLDPDFKIPKSRGVQSNSSRLTILSFQFLFFFLQLFVPSRLLVSAHYYPCLCPLMVGSPFGNCFWYLSAHLLTCLLAWLCYVWEKGERRMFLLGFSSDSR